MTDTVRRKVRGYHAAAAALALMAFGLAGCHRHAEEHKAMATARKEGAAKRIIVLPDSAIAVERGSPEEQLADFLASDAPPPRTFRFQGAEYESWASNPNPQTLRRIFMMTQILHAYPHAKVTLAGYTDNEGTAEQNLALATARVDKMAEILVHGRVRASHIQTIGKGAVDFVADNATPEGRARNRRIELTVTAK